jgi:hypothetical protein
LRKKRERRTSEPSYLVNLYTAVDSKNNYRPWINIQSAGWVNIQSARTMLSAPKATRSKLFSTTPAHVETTASAIIHIMVHDSRRIAWCRSSLEFSLACVKPQLLQPSVIDALLLKMVRKDKFH